MRYIISGGGTGGHIYPAIAIAKAVEKIDADAEILFVGAENRMEMEKVPQASYKIIGLPVAGFSRSNIFSNFKVGLLLLKSLRKAKKIIQEFNPDVAVGVGGYASGPVLKKAQKYGVPTILQEQNSYAGVTNKLLAKNAKAICVAYENMDKFFPAERIILTGNPLRESIKSYKTLSKKSAKNTLGFNCDRKLVVAIGGSLGARTINESIKAALPSIIENGADVLWQTGKRFFEEYQAISENYSSDRVKIVPYIENMETVYAAADIIISRAGASTISEIQYIGKPAVLIPSPNVAEDHQRKNAESLSSIQAAVTLLDKDAVSQMPEIITELIKNEDKLRMMSENVKKLSKPDADVEIAHIIFEIAQRNSKQ